MNTLEKESTNKLLFHILPHIYYEIRVVIAKTMFFVSDFLDCNLNLLTKFVFQNKS